MSGCFHLKLYLFTSQWKASSSLNILVLKNMYLSIIWNIRVLLISLMGKEKPLLKSFLIIVIQKRDGRMLTCREFLRIIIEQNDSGLLMLWNIFQKRGGVNF